MLVARPTITRRLGDPGPVQQHSRVPVYLSGHRRPTTPTKSSLAPHFRFHLDSSRLFIYLFIYLSVRLIFLGIHSAIPADDMIAEGVRDFLHAVDAPPESVPAATAATAGPAATQLVQSAAAGRTMLRQQAATRRTRIRVVDSLRRVVLWRVRERRTRLLHYLILLSPPSSS